MAQAGRPPQLPPGRKLQLASGAKGTAQTLALMAALVRHGKQQPEVRAQAQALVADLLQKDYRAEAERIHNFVRDEVRYTKDVRGIETLHTAPQLLRQRQGDCDDKTVLAASLLEAIGHKTRLVAVGAGGVYRHVYPEVLIRGEWIAVETTEPWPLGKAPAMPMRMVKNV